MQPRNRIVLCGLLFASGCGSTAPPSEPVALRPRPVFDAKSDPHSAGKKLIVAHGCLRCHTIHLARDEANLDQGGGSELGKTGADPKRDAAWFMDFVRRPDSFRPGTRMPAFKDKMTEAEFRALAEYLTSLK